MKLPIFCHRDPLAMLARGCLGVAVVVFVPLVVTGCGNFTQLDLNDKSAMHLSVRALHRFGVGPGGGGIEGELTSVRATGGQQLGATQTATLNDQSISGPANLTHTARVQHAQVVYNHLLFAGRPVEMEWFAGVAWQRLSWHTASTTSSDPRLTLQSDWVGPAGGALGRVRLNPSLALELRYGAATRLTGGAGSRGSTELALAFKPAPPLVLRLGYAKSNAFDHQSNVSTEVFVSARGPFLSLGLDL